MILYKTVVGAEEEGDTDNRDSVSTVPHAVISGLKQRLIAERPSSFPMETVPEEAELPENHIPPEVPEDFRLPEDRLEDDEDPNVELVDSDEEPLEPLEDWQPSTESQDRT